MGLVFQPVRKDGLTSVNAGIKKETNVNMYTLYTHLY